jgi:uncharacterized protein (TIGR03435 family)
MKIRMQRAIAFTVIAGCACAQITGPSFEVATIKPGVPDSPGKIIRPNHRNFSTLNTTLIDLITYAWCLHPRQIVGAPGWAETDKYDLAGIPDTPGTPGPDQVKVMVQKLLADRFGLAFHREKKELNVFTITVAKTGSKLTSSEGSGNTSVLLRALGKLVVKNATMADFAGVMQANALDRPVLDRTELSGKFDFTLEWLPDETHPEENDSRPTLFAAIQQLGLKLEDRGVRASALSRMGLESHEVR